MIVKPRTIAEWDIVPETAGDDFLMDAFLDEWLKRSANIILRFQNGRALVLRSEQMPLKLLPPPDTMGEKIRKTFSN